MAIEAPFSSLSEARSTYSTDSSGSSDNTNSGSTSWGKLQQDRRLESGGWVLAHQNQQSGDRQRYFVIRTKDGALQAINSQGNVVEPGGQAALAEYPHYPTEDDAISAYEKWAKANGEDPQNKSDQWSKWRKLRQIDPWWVFSRTHKSKDRAQFTASGQTSDGKTVYLGADGGIKSSPTIFDSKAALKQALNAYFKKVEAGDIPKSKQPTGQSPDTKTVRKALKKSVRTASSSKKVLGQLGSKPVLIGAVGLVGVYALKQSSGNGGSQ